MLPLRRHHPRLCKSSHLDVDVSLLEPDCLKTLLSDLTLHLKKSHVDSKFERILVRSTPGHRD